MNELYIALVAIGGLVLVLGVLASYIKKQWFLTEPVVALLLGILLGPVTFGLLSPSGWGNQNVFLEETARLTLAIGDMAVALRLPAGYPLRQWRSLPAVLALKPLIPQLKGMKDALFVGWFGPIGISAVLYAMLALRRTGYEEAWTIGSLLICVSLIVHGGTATPLARLYGRHSSNTRSNES